MQSWSRACFRALGTCCMFSRAWYWLVYSVVCVSFAWLDGITIILQLSREKVYSLVSDSTGRLFHLSVGDVTKLNSCTVRIFRVINAWCAAQLGEKKPASRLAICFHVDLTDGCLDGKSGRRRTNDWFKIRQTSVYYTGLSRRASFHLSSRNVPL